MDSVLSSGKFCVEGAEHWEVGDSDGVFSPIPELMLL